MFVADVHIDQFLTNISLAYTNEMLVGDMVFPPFDVDELSDFYPIYGQENFKKYDDLRQPGASALEIRQSLSKGAYVAQEHSLKTQVTASENRFADSPLNPQVDATEFLTDTVRNQREFRQLAVASDPTQITQNLALSGTSLWSDYTNSAPLTNIRAARSAVRSGVHRQANRMLIAYDAALVLADHPSVKDLIKYTDPNNIAEHGLPTVMRGLTVDVSGADQDTSSLGAASPTFVPAYSKAALVYYQNPNPGLRSVVFGLTLEAPDGATGQRGFQARSWFDEDKKATWIEVSNTYVIKLFAPLAGFLFSPAIA